MSAGLLSAAAVEVGLITWRDIGQAHVIPPPSDYAAVALIYGLLGMAPDNAKTVASIIGWGFVVATFLRMFDPTHPTKFAQGTSTSLNLPFAGGTKTSRTAGATPPPKGATL